MPPLLRVERLTRTFAGLAALQGVSFELAAGGIYGLIGPNGAGKTTLLAILAGALRPTAGRIVFAERDVTGMPAFAAVRAGIVRTHQVPRPFRTLSVLDNVEVGIRFGRAPAAGSPAVGGGGAAGGGGGGARDVARSARDAAGGAVQVLERVGLAHRARALAGTLSVGDQKRLELARALAAEPSLLLCDEVCSGLTAAETEAVLRLLREIRADGTTILYVEHDLKAIMAVCDRVIVMDHGQKLAEGSPAEVQANPAVIEAYIGASRKASASSESGSGSGESAGRGEGGAAVSAGSAEPAGPGKG